MGELRSEKEAFPTWSEKLPFPPSGQKNCPFPKTEHYGENGLFCRAGYNSYFVTRVEMGRFSYRGLRFETDRVTTFCHERSEGQNIGTRECFDPQTKVRK